jgi:hypothetical protein
MKTEIIPLKCCLSLKTTGEVIATLIKLKTVIFHLYFERPEKSQSKRKTSQITKTKTNPKQYYSPPSSSPASGWDDDQRRFYLNV